MEDKNELEVMRKTIFIVISQGFIIRNIFRSGGFSLFRKAGYRMVIFIHCKQIPGYLTREFGGNNVVLIPIGKTKPTKMHRLFIQFTHYLIRNKTTERYFRYSQHYVDRNRFEVFFHLLALHIFSRLAFLRPLVRFVETKFFPEYHQFIVEYFNHYKPYLLFSTSITSGIDNIFLKEAKRRNIKTVSMPKSWDNLTKMFLRFMPDYFIVQNEILRDRLVDTQGFTVGHSYVTGFPEFDWYARKDIIRSRKEHLARLGLDDKLPVLFFASQGKWYDQDYKIAEMIYGWVKNNELTKPCQMIVRPHPHFLSGRDNPFLRFRGKPHVAYDDAYHISADFYDDWDPSDAETIQFINTIIHSDIIILVLSTLALDGVCADKPIINVVFGSKFRGKKDITSRMRFTEHYKWIFDTNGTSVALSPSKLKEYINRYLENPNMKSRERGVLRDRVCYKVDGRSSERMVRAIDHILRLSSAGK